jgi:hypothetical protein
MGNDQRIEGKLLLMPTPPTVREEKEHKERPSIQSYQMRPSQDQKSLSINRKKKSARQKPEYQNVEKKPVQSCYFNLSIQKPI